jgi:predicted RecA/RadA family phage recombinase
MYIRLLFFIAVLVGIIWAIIKLKNSSSVDKISDGLFSAPKDKTVDEAIDGIASNKKTLKDKSAQNAQTIKDVAQEQEKINKHI